MLNNQMVKPIKNRSKSANRLAVFKGRTEGVPPKTGFFERPHEKKWHL